MNVVIMISVLSVGNSAIYASSRILAALAEQHQAPRFLAYIDRKGRPVISICIASSLGLLAFFAVSDKQQEAFDWMLALSGLSSIFTWGSVCLAHIRFRRAWRVQGHSLDELAFKSPVGVYGSWIGFVFNVLVLTAQFWTGFAPVNWETMTGHELAVNFFQAYLAAPVVIVCYVGCKLYYRPPIMRTAEMDLFTGKRDINVKELMADERMEKKAWPKWKKTYKFFC